MNLLSSFYEKKMPLFSGKQEAYPKVQYTPALSSPRYEDNRISSVGSSAGSRDELLEKVQQLSPRTSFWRRRRALIIVHFFIFGTYLVILWLVATYSKSQAGRAAGLPFSPAIEAVVYEEHKFSLEDRIQERGKFSGKPRPELDQAWHDLLNDENIRLEPEVLKHYGREDIGVAIPDNDGYIGTLNVYHELHCIKRLHQYMYEDNYWPNASPKTKEMNRLHNEHCLDFLRQSAMCHGDIGLITYEWVAHDTIPVANATTHQCVNWEKLDSWTKARSVDMMKPGWLVHPTLGLAYPTGEGDNVGVSEAKKDDHHH